MKLLRLLSLIFIILLASSLAYPQSQPPITIRESDGSPKLIQPTEIIVPNGSLTISGRKATLTFSGAPGPGTVTSVSVVTANGISGSVANPTSTPALTLTVQNAVADGSTKGIASFTPADFNASSGNISIDYTNAQKATGSVPGLLTAADWAAFNAKPTNGAAANVVPKSNGTNFVTSRISDDGTTTQIGPTSFGIELLSSNFSVKLGNIDGTDGNGSLIEILSHDVFLGDIDTNAFAFAQFSPDIKQVDIGSNGTHVTLDGAANDINFTGGSVNIGTSTAVASAIFNIVSTTQGLLPPRMTTTQRDAISSPAEGLYLYNLTTHVTNYWNGSTWLNGGGGVPTSRTITTTSPITIDGGTSADLSANRTIACVTCGVTGTGLNQFASTTSAQLLGIISNETGSGLVMGNDTPTIITPSFTTGFTIAGAAASRKIIVGNGTNFVASTETYPVPGTSGNLMTSDGTNWTSAAASGGGSGDVIANATRTTNALTKWTNTTTKEIGNSLIVDDGTNILLNLAATNGLLQLGGATSSFPALSFTGTRIDFVTANNAALADIQASKLTLSSSNGLFLGTQTRIIGTSGVAEFVNVGASAYASARVDTIFLTGASLLNDTAINRTAAGVARFTDASSGFSWFQWGGQAYLGSDQTNATTTLASSTLSITLQSSRKYTFKSILYVSDSTAAEGVKIDFGGGTATATNFRTHCTGFDTALGISTQVTSLTSTVSAGTFTGNGMIECHGSFEVNSGGTFIPRFAQATHAIGTLTLFRGSHLQVFDTP